MTETQTPRTPLWAMTDEQLTAIIEDEFTEWERLQIARSIMADRRADANERVGFVLGEGA